MSLPVLSVAMMREWEDATWATGRTEAEVIVRVGQAIAGRVLSLTPDGDRVLVLAGKGHNGDDARAALPHLARREVTHINVTNPAAQLGEVQSALALRPTLVVDALFGIGLNRTLDEVWQNLIAELNAARLRVLSVDAPSGLNCDSGGTFGAAVRADITLTVGAPKLGMLAQPAWQFVGRLEVASDVGLVRIFQDLVQPAVTLSSPSEGEGWAGRGVVGFREDTRLLLGRSLNIPASSPQSSPPSDGGEGEETQDSMPVASGELVWVEPGDFANFPQVRSVASHKGDFGHIGILAGSMGYHGAAVLAARAAQRAHAGLVTLHTMPDVYHAAAAQLQGAMVRPWNAETNLSPGFSALLVGPGLADPASQVELRTVVCKLWRDSELPVVVDASALDWIREGPTSKGAVRIITPHPGEAARLLKTSAAQIQADRPRALREISQRFGDCWVVLKGHQTLMGRSTGEIAVNSSGNPLLAQGGSGDVLVGYIAGLVAQPALLRDLATTLRFAVWQHGAAADALTERRPNWIVDELASEMGR